MKSFKSSFSRDKSRSNSDITNEIVGLLIIGAGLLLFLAVWSYDATDQVFWSGRHVETNNYTRTGNWLGPIGATIAKPIFEYTFGYPAIFFPLLLIGIGTAVMLEKPLKILRGPATGLLLWAFFFSMVLAMRESLETAGQSQTYYPSGAIGGFITDRIVQYLGPFALAFLMSIFCLIMLMLTFRFKVSILPEFLAGLLHHHFQNLRRWVTRLSQATIRYYRQTVAAFKSIPWFWEGKKGGESTRKTSRKSAARSTPEPEEDDRVLSFEDMEPEERSGPEIYQHPLPEMDDVDSPFQDIPDSPMTPTTELSLPETLSPLDPDIEAELSGLPELDEEGLELPEADISISPLAEDIEEIPAAVSAAEYENKIRQALDGYEMPSFELLNEDTAGVKMSREELMQNADLLENTLSQFGVKAFVKKVIEGPVITMYAVRPAEGVKINQVVSLSDDLALAMRAKGIRMIAPIPGEAAIGIEIPNRRPTMVTFKSIMRSEKFRENSGQLVLGMGKTISGEVFCADLARMPHLLIAGATGAGKSVGINTIIASIIYRVPPSDVKFVMIDPKKLELSLYAKLKDQYLAFCPDIDEIVITHPQNAILILRAVVNEMEERYDTLAQVGVRDIIAYNKRVEKYNQTGENTEGFRKLPYIVVIIDELADLILTASREVEEPITRLAQMARAVGIHLIVATQRPSVDILTGLIKANFPTRIAYQVATRPDSKVILDQFGAEKLIGNGDMLYLPPGTGKPVRLQNPFLSTEEVEKIIKHVRNQPKFPPYELKLTRQKAEPGGAAASKNNQDELFDKAKEIVVRHQQGSVSLLQRKLKIGYARAGRLMDLLEDAGVVGPGQGSKARDVLMSGYEKETSD
ncbi:MAG TPA: DNA translocase FtsK [Calditrichia bacterium]|nr:DNA translocase FtsK [Calditrichia bacterium]